MEEQLNPNQGIMEINQQELVRLEGARQQFVLMGNTIPERRMVSFGDIVSKFGVEVILRVLSTMGAALVSATAVGAVMQLTDQKLRGAFAAETDSVGSGIFWWSMLAFEGTLMAAGLGKGRKNTGISDSWAPVIAGGVVTVVGGFLRSLTLTNNAGWELFAAWIFAVAVAIAGPVVSFFGSENVGFILQEIQALQDIYDQEWEAQKADWEDRFERFYARFAKQVHGVDRRRKARFEDQQPQQVPQQQEEEEENSFPNLRGTLWQFLVDNQIDPRQVGDTTKGAAYSPAQIAHLMGITNKRDKDSVRKYVNQFRQKLTKEEENANR